MHGCSTTEIAQHDERRVSFRVHCCGERLAWKPEQTRRSRKGWLNDVSPEGVSFLIEQRRAPNAGDTVEVRTDPQRQPMRCTVVRITQEGDDLALVACALAPTESPMAMAA